MSCGCLCLWGRPLSSGLPFLILDVFEVNTEGKLIIITITIIISLCGLRH